MTNVRRLACHKKDLHIVFVRTSCFCTYKCVHTKMVMLAGFIVILQTLDLCFYITDRLQSFAFQYQSYFVYVPVSCVLFLHSYSLSFKEVGPTTRHVNTQFLPSMPCKKQRTVLFKILFHIHVTFSASGF